MDGNRNDRKFLSEFIELYHSFPCLWKIKSLEYNDRDAKRKAYVVLVKKLRQRIPNATRETVVRKINTLRTTYRREWRKVIRSSEEVSSTGNNGHHNNHQQIHVPQLWYFDLMHFIRNDDDDDDEDYGQGDGQGGQISGMINQDSNEHPEDCDDDLEGQFNHNNNNSGVQAGCLTKFEECSVTDSELLDPTVPDNNNVVVESFPQLVLPHISSFSSSSSFQTGGSIILKPPPQTSQNPNKRKSLYSSSDEPPPTSLRSIEEQFAKLQELIETRLPPPLVARTFGGGCDAARTHAAGTSSSDDQFSQIAQIWANKLRQLPRERALFAEKKINDILFEACLGNLHIHSLNNHHNQQHNPTDPINFTNSTNYGGGNANSSAQPNNNTQPQCNGFQ